ncbi:MAG: hypothetical protein Q4P29_04930, partial [Tissierellia bacterium]|nr:hypothetical protein [Tissierellia bacterium]
MKKRFFSIILALVIMATSFTGAFAQYLPYNSEVITMGESRATWDHIEKFSNFKSKGTSYNDDTIVGDTNVEWEIKNARKAPTEYSIEGGGITLHFDESKGNSYIKGKVQNGIGSIEIDVRKAFTSDQERVVYLYINGEKKDSVFINYPGKNSEIFKLKAYNLNIPAEAEILIRSDKTEKARQVTINNLRWTDYEEKVPPLPQG